MGAITYTANTQAFFAFHLGHLDFQFPNGHASQQPLCSLEMVLPSGFGLFPSLEISNYWGFHIRPILTSLFPFWR